MFSRAIRFLIKIAPSRDITFSIENDIDLERVTANQRRWTKGATRWHRGYIDVCLSEYPENYVKSPLAKGR